jgi:hypothetical protein
MNVPQKAAGSREWIIDNSDRLLSQSIRIINYPFPTAPVNPVYFHLDLHLHASYKEATFIDPFLFIISTEIKVNSVR